MRMVDLVQKVPSRIDKVNSLCEELPQIYEDDKKSPVFCWLCLVVGNLSKTEFVKAIMKSQKTPRRY